MTGPLFFTRHPDRRRARLLVPLTAAILVAQLACSSDQLTEPTANIKAQPLVATTGPHPRARLTAASRATNAKPKALVSFKVSPSFGVAQSVAGEGPSVLILADTDAVATSALAASLADSGVRVTLRPAPENTWDGTNPSLTGFDVVIHLNGNTYDAPLSGDAQTVLTNFVANGGGFVGAQWNGYEPQANLASLVLQGTGYEVSNENCSGCTVTYERLPAGEGHPVLAGLPASFSFTADGHDAAAAVESATPLMRVPSGGPAVLVRELGSGRVVNFSFAPNYPWDDTTVTGTHELVTLQDAKVQHLYLNAVRWAAGSAQDVAVPQTITFESLGDKVFGDAAFSISASASSGLPVNFTGSGQCAVVGSTVSITGAGSCSITAHQAGNDAYAPADDVSRSFDILKAPASITVGTEYFYDGTVKSASITTSPGALSGVTVTYTLNGTLVSQPINAGVYQVVARLDNPNYAAEPATGTLTIKPATPVLEWQPARISVGTPLSAAQLNAVARGVNGASLSGRFIYTPAMGTRLKAGVQTLSVTFTPASDNYIGARKSVEITVELGKSDKPGKKAAVILKRSR